MTSIDEEINRLNDLYWITDRDWELRVYHCLTEPSCPTVIIQPEGMETTRYRVDRNSIEEGIRLAVDLVYRDIFGDENISSITPFTNPDDKEMLKLLPEWRKKAKKSLNPVERNNLHET